MKRWASLVILLPWAPCLQGLFGSKFEKVQHFGQKRAFWMVICTPLWTSTSLNFTHQIWPWGGAPCTIPMSLGLWKYIGGCKSGFHAQMVVPKVMHLFKFSPCYLQPVFLMIDFCWDWCSEAPCGAVEGKPWSYGGLVEWRLMGKVEGWMGVLAVGSMV